MSKSIPKGAWFGAFIVVFAVYIYLLGPQTFFALQTRKMGRQTPIVKSVPGELEDRSVAQSKGERLSFQGVEFEVPWSDLDQEKTQTAGNCALVKFRSGNSIMLCVLAPNGFMSNLFRNKQAEPELFTRLYGPEVLHSDYALMKAIYGTTPHNITLFTPSNRAAGLASILLIKSIAPPTTDWAIYNIRSNEFRGFQLGNPNHHPIMICLQLYADNIELECTLGQGKTGYSPIIQGDLNRIIQSAHKTAQKQSTLTVNPA